MDLDSNPVPPAARPTEGGLAIVGSDLEIASPYLGTPVRVPMAEIAVVGRGAPQTDHWTRPARVLALGTPDEVQDRSRTLTLVFRSPQLLPGPGGPAEVDIACVPVRYLEHTAAWLTSAGLAVEPPRQSPPTPSYEVAAAPTSIPSPAWLGEPMAPAPIRSRRRATTAVIVAAAVAGSIVLGATLWFSGDDGSSTDAQPAATTERDGRGASSRTTTPSIPGDGEPALRTLSNADIDEFVHTVTIDGNVSVKSTEITATAFAAEASAGLGMADTGFVSGFIIADGMRRVDVTFQQFDSAAAAGAVDIAAARLAGTQMGAARPLDTKAMQASGFVCDCGSVYLSFVRDNLRVRILLGGIYSDTSAVALTLAQDLDRQLPAA
jgi:hypothetical protein